jgi:uncharacterized integral membrane protein
MKFTVIPHLVSFSRNIVSLVRRTFDQFSNALLYLPLTISILTISIFLLRLAKVAGIIVYFTPLNIQEFPKSQEIAINLTIELNKYIISIGAALFGLVGFYFNNYVQHLSIRSINLAFLLALILLGIGGFYAFLIYTELTNSLSQGVYPLNPGNSKILAYIELEFILCLGASLSLGSIFVAIQSKITSTVKP